MSCSSREEIDDGWQARKPSRMNAKRSGGGNASIRERFVRCLELLTLITGLLVSSGCASYSHALIAKPHKEVATKLQQHFTSEPREIYGLEQTVNRKVARFQFSEELRKVGGIQTEVFALPTDDGTTRVMVRTVNVKPRVIGWSEATRMPDREARWLERIKGLFRPEAR